MTGPAPTPPHPWAKLRSFNPRTHLIPVLAVIATLGWAGTAVAGRAFGAPRQASAKAEKEQAAAVKQSGAAAGREAAQAVLAAVPTTAPPTTVPPWNPLTGPPSMLACPLTPGARQLIGFASTPAGVPPSEWQLRPDVATEVAKQAWAALQAVNVSEADLTIRIVETGPKGAERQRKVDGPTSPGHPVPGQQALVDCAPRSTGRGVPIPTVTTQAGAS